MKRATGCVLWALLLGGNLAAAAPALRLAPLFGDDAVIQSGQPVPVWGWAAPKQAIILRYGAQHASTEADSTGRWKATLPAPATGVIHDLIVTAGDEEQRCRNVVAGEVWFCSGQSNMQLQVSRARDAAQEIAAAHHPQIHEFLAGIQVADRPAETIPGRWQVCSPQTVGDFSAVAYYFARRLTEDLHTPVGIIVAAKGGSPVEAWLTPAGIQDSPSRDRIFERLRLAEAAWRKRGVVKGTGQLEPGENDFPMFGEGGYCVPSVLRQGMFDPLAGYGVRGILWYQGEANTSPNFANGAEYGQLFQEMITEWRNRWGEPNLPFYFVQLTSNRVPGRDRDGQMWAGIREAQREALTLPATGMAVTIDLGEPDLMHPTRKQEVGGRLARIAEAKTYGKAIPSQGPNPQACRREGDTLVVDFDTAVMTRENAAAAGFEIAGTDGVFQPATVTLRDHSAALVAPGVRAPCSVRYAWRPDPSADNLISTAGLPAGTFRLTVQ